MRTSDLVPVSALAHGYGVKCIVYGPPGQAKTPIVATTTPRPVICLVEPGANSLRDCNHIPAWDAVGNTARVTEFVQWAMSPDAAPFDTLIIDSVSEYAENVLNTLLPKQKDPRKAYGLMNTEVYDNLSKLFYLRGKHVVLICKENESEIDGVFRKQPRFPGNAIYGSVSHLYDGIFYQHTTRIHGVPKPQLAVRTAPTPGIIARARVTLNSTLQELEPPHYGNIFAKLI